MWASSIVYHNAFGPQVRPKFVRVNRNVMHRFKIVLEIVNSKVKVSIVTV